MRAVKLCLNRLRSVRLAPLPALPGRGRPGQPRLGCRLLGRGLLVVLTGCVVVVTLPPPPVAAQSANWFVDSLGQVKTSLSTLIPELRRHSSSSAVREGLSQLYQVESDAAELVARTRRGDSYEDVAAAYRRLDLRWRDAAFRLRSSGEISPTISSLMNRIDGVFRTIDRRLGLKPPIDRVRLRDLMIVTLTYMDAMFDDIRLARGYSAQSEDLLIRGRLLRERLRQESHRIEGADFDEIVASFNEFVGTWRGYAQSLHQLNDPHVHRRLESIRRQGDEVFATLRIPPALDRAELAYVTRRLPTELNDLADQVGRWGAQRLTSAQFRFVETCRALSERARRLATEVERSGASSAARDQFLEIDNAWREGLRLMASVDVGSGLQSSLARVNTSFREVRDLLGTGSWRSRSEMLALAASLESSAETFDGDVQRFKRLLEPAGYRDRLATASENFYQTSRTLHRQVSELDQQRFAAETARKLVAQWNELTPLVNDLSGRGLSGPRAELIHANYRQLQPLVTQASTLLTD